MLHCRPLREGSVRLCDAEIIRVSADGSQAKYRKYLGMKACVSSRWCDNLKGRPRDEARATS